MLDCQSLCDNALYKLMTDTFSDIDIITELHCLLQQLRYQWWCWYTWGISNVIIIIVSSSSKSWQRPGLRWSNACYSEQRAVPWPRDGAHKITATRLYWQPVECRGLVEHATSRHQSRTQLCRIQGPSTVTQRVAVRRTWHWILRVQGLLILFHLCFLFLLFSLLLYYIAYSYNCILLRFVK